MQETLKKKSSDATEPMDKTVSLCIRSKRFVLNGEWVWDMQSTAVYCSDVMEFPSGFEGTKGIIHPDDLHNLHSAMELLPDGRLAALDFRIITTYGQVQALNGKNVSLENADNAEVAQREAVPWESSLELLALRREAEFLQQRTALAETTEKLYLIGSWVMNKSTGETWYSDGMYRLHGLPPQSLNAHQNTFHPFLHPEDRTAFLDAFEAAYDAGLPLHVEYRIQLADGTAKTVRLVTQWNVNSKGQPLFSGILHDLTGEFSLASQVTEAAGKAQVQQQVLKFSEQAWNTGYWFMNLVTRKATYSDNYYRIYGLKPQGLPNSNAFLNLVHPDDRDRVERLIYDMYREHSLPETEFRILRPDGKQRTLKQGGKVFVSKPDLVMVGVVQDITVQRGLEKKIAELNERAALQEAVQRLTEAFTETSFISWSPDGAVTWSEGFYRLLGYKPGSAEPAARLLHRQIHPDDVKAYKQAELLALNGQPQEAVRFRLVNRGGQRQVSMGFLQIGPLERQTVVGLAKDLTKDDLFRQKLAETGHYAEVLNKSISDMVILTDAENTVISWNSAAEEKTGIRAGDAVYGNLFDLLPALMNESFLGHLHTVRAGTGVRELNVRNRYLRQAHHYFLVPFKDERGEVVRVLHVVQDVSRELDLQQQLTERLRFIESLVEASVDRIVVLDRHMNYLYWNKKAEDYYAISKTKVIGRNILEVFPGLRNDPSYGEFRKVLKGETVYLPAVFQQDNGDYFETYLIPVKDDSNSVTAILWIVHDLTNEYKLREQEQRAKETLAKEHQQLKEAQAIGRVGSFEWDAVTDKIYWSDEMYRIHGLEPQSEEITLERVLSFILPEDEPTLQRISDLRKTPGRMDATQRIVRADGKVIVVRRQIQSFANEEGTVTYLAGTIQDITEQRNTEQRIQEQAHYLQRITETTPDMISIMDLETRQFTFLNAETFKRYGFDPVAMSRNSQEQNAMVVHPDDHAVLNDYFGRLAVAESDEQIVGAEYRAKTIGGDWRWFLVRGKVFQRNEEGKPTQVLNVIENVSERKKAEGELESTKEFLQATLDTSLYVVQAFQAVRDEKGAIVDFVWLYVNKRWKEKYGDEMRGKRLLQENPGVIETGLFKSFVEVTETGVPVEHEVYYPYGQFNGWFFQTLAKMGDGFVMTTVEITERKKAEEELLRLKDEIAKRATDRYHTIFNSIDEGFSIIELIFNEQGKPIDFIYRVNNPAFIKHVGLDLQGKRRSELSFDKKDLVLEKYEHVFTTGEPVHFEYSVQSLGGQWFEVTATRIGGEGSRHIGVIFRNITERKQTELRQAFLLRISDALRTEQNPEAIANLAIEMVFEELQVDRCYISEVFEKKGYSTVGPERLRPGMSPMSGVFQLADYPETMREMITQPLVIDDADNDPRFSDFQKKMLALVPQRALLVAPLRKGAGQVIWAMAVAMSTPRKWTEAERLLLEEVAERTWAAIERAKAEKALAESEEKYRAVFNSINEGFSLLEVQFNEAGEACDIIFRDANPAQDRIDGVRALIGKSVREVLPNIELKWIQRYGRIALTGEHEQFEDWSEANQRWYEVDASRIGGENSRLVAIVYNDITERKQREQQQAYLLLLNDALHSLADPIDVQQKAMQILGEHLNVDRVVFADINVEEDYFEVIDNYTARSVKKLTGRFPFSAFGPSVEILKKGDSLVIDNVSVAVLHEEEKKQFFAMDVQAVVAVPLLKTGRLVMDLSIHQASPRQWRKDEITLVQETAERTWAAVERAKAEKALRESEAHLRSISVSLEQQVEERATALQESAVFVKEITQTTPDRITIHHALTTEILYTNHPEFWKELYGNNDIYQHAAAQRAIGLVHPDEEEKFRTFLQQRNRLADGEVSEIELRLKGDKWVHIRSKVFKRDEQGAASQIISFTTDITEQKKGELELQKNLAILQQTEELAQIGSWEYDVVTGKFNWSEGMYNLFGLKSGTPVRPETYLDFSAIEDRTVAKRIIKNLKKAHQSFEETLRIKWSNHERLLRIKGSVVSDEHNRPQRIVGVDLDITDIKEAEENVAQSRHWLEQTAQASPDAISVYDLQKKQPIYLNDCLARWLGTTSNELVKTGIDGRLELVHPDDRLRLLHFNELLKAARDGDVLVLEYRLRTRQNLTLWIRNRSKIFQRDPQGKVSHLLSFLQDVTEEKAAADVRKALNNSLEKQNQELEQKNEEITSFAFVASHDLKEPIRKIHTFTDWLLTKETGLSESGVQHLQRTSAAVKRLDLLIDDILALTKVHVNHEQPKIVDLNALLQQLKEESCEKLAKTNAVLEIEPLPFIPGAENLLYYLFKNLISNAIKFQPKEKQPVVRISAIREEGYLKIAVTDNGLGIAKEHHKKIFEMFRRLHAREEYEGTGMGLAICKKIMEKHNGKITVDSDSGKGTTFTCWFPATLST